MLTKRKCDNCNKVSVSDTDSELRCRKCWYGNLIITKKLKKKLTTKDKIKKEIADLDERKYAIKTNDGRVRIPDKPIRDMMMKTINSDIRKLRRQLGESS